MAQLKKGVPFDEAMTREGMLDTRDLPGLLLIDSPAGIGDPSFHLGAVSTLIVDRIALEGRLDIEEHVLSNSLESAWGITGHLGQSSCLIVPQLRKCWEPYVIAISTAWPELNSVGPRYSRGLRSGDWLWSIPNRLHYVLANMGVPQSLLRAPLPPEGPMGLLRYAKSRN